MSDFRADDLEQALTYERICDSMRSDAKTYIALAASVQEDPALGTFARAYADLIRRGYERLADGCMEAADQAASIAVDYRSHVDGSYVPLRSA